MQISRRSLIASFVFAETIPGIANPGISDGAAVTSYAQRTGRFKSIESNVEQQIADLFDVALFVNDRLAMPGQIIRAGDKVTVQLLDAPTRDGDLQIDLIAD